VAADPASGTEHWNFPGRPGVFRSRSREIAAMRRPRPGQIEIKAKEEREPRSLQERRARHAIEAKDAMAAY
jgi:hypothetical protein